MSNNNLIVVCVGAEGARKLRHLFLFNDVLVCAKYKAATRGEKFTFQLKWYIPLSEVGCVFPLRGLNINFQNLTISFLKERNVALPCSFRSPCFILTAGFRSTRERDQFFEILDLIYSQNFNKSIIFLVHVMSVISIVRFTKLTVF